MSPSRHAPVLAEVSPLQALDYVARRVTDHVDIFCLYYDAKTKKVGGINGSGRAPKDLSLEYLRKQGVTGDTVSQAALWLAPAVSLSDATYRSRWTISIRSLCPVQLQAGSRRSRRTGQASCR